MTGIDGLARQPRCLDDSIHRHTIAMLQEHLHSHVQYSPVDLRRSFKTGAAGPLMVWLQQYPLSLLSTILSFFSSIANYGKLKKQCCIFIMIRLSRPGGVIPAIRMGAS